MTKTICLLFLATLCCVQGAGLRPESDVSEDVRFLPSISGTAQGIKDFFLPNKPTLKPKYPAYKPHYRPYKPYEEKPSKPVKILIPVPLPVPVPGKRAPIKLLVQVANIQEAGGVGGKLGKGGFVGNSIGKPSVPSAALGSAVGGGLGGALGESLIAPAADVVGNVNTINGPFGQPFQRPFGSVVGGNFGRPVDGAGNILDGSFKGPIGGATDKDDNLF